MSRSRCTALVVVTVALLMSFANRTLAQTPEPEDAPASQTRKAVPSAADCACVVHSVGTLADDPKFAKWVVETIPNMVQPGTWATGRQISYYAPGRMLVVRHTPAVQTEIKALLAEMQKAAAAARPMMSDRQVVPARFTEARPLEPVAGTRGGYPIPAPTKQPKHLFHLILRYEGDGLDSTALTGLMAQLNAVDTNKDKEGDMPAPDALKGSPLGQLLHFIVRYEGEGIIDSNVAALVRDIYGASQGANGPGVAPQRWAVPAVSVGVEQSCVPAAVGAAVPQYGTPSLPPCELLQVQPQRVADPSVGPSVPVDPYSSTLPAPVTAGSSSTNQQSPPSTYSNGPGTSAPSVTGTGR